ncbi:MAG: heparinase II/III family protein, partial [Candidatus Eremiobacterota bacterium]
MFKGIKRRVKSLLGRPEDLEARLELHARERLPFAVEEEELYLQLEPLTAALEEARSAARSNRLHEASEHLLEHFHDRIRPLFFIHHSECDMLRPGLLERPEECNRVLAEAERAQRHAFSPLGVEEYTFPSAIDWFSDFRGSSWMYGPVEDLKLQLERQEPSSLPEGPLEATWEFNRHSHFVDMGRAYWLTGQERFASEFIVQMVDWSERNPALFGVNWLDPETVAHRTLNWLLATHLFLKSAQMTSDVLSRLLRTLLAHGLVLSRMLNSQSRLGVASSLHVLAASLPEVALARQWLRQSAPTLAQQALRELGSEGFHAGGSLGCHRQACEWLLLPLALHRLNQSHPPEGLAGCAEEAVDALCQVRPPNALVPEFGRPPGGGLLSHGTGPSEHTLRLLGLAALTLGNGGLARLAGEMPPELLWWFGPSAQARYDGLPHTGMPPPGGVFPR